jgi:AbrB family looped-hinge helix DNA binding protein
MKYGTAGASFTARMEANGRIVIPARVREALGLVAGSQLTLSVDGEALVIRSKAARIRQVRERLLAQQTEREAAGAPPAGQVVQDFLAERREEEARRLRRLDALFPDRVTSMTRSADRMNDQHD